MSTVTRPFINGFMNPDHVFSVMLTHVLEQGHHFLCSHVVHYSIFPVHCCPAFA